jgi:hypothetical protein
MQKALIAHDTPARVVNSAPAGFGVGTTVHPSPCHCSASAVVGTLFNFVEDEPTAMHEKALVQDTPPNSLWADPWGWATVSLTHFVPFQCSASASRPMLVQEPTAVQADEVGHDTDGS